MSLLTGIARWRSQSGIGEGITRCHAAAEPDTCTYNALTTEVVFDDLGPFARFHVATESQSKRLKLLGIQNLAHQGLVDALISKSYIG